MNYDPNMTSKSGRKVIPKGSYFLFNIHIYHTLWLINISLLLSYPTLYITPVYSICAYNILKFKINDTCIFFVESLKNQLLTLLFNKHIFKHNISYIMKLEKHYAANTTKSKLKNVKIKVIGGVDSSYT